MTLLAEVSNSRLKQYYYDVIKELYNIGLSDISMTEHFYFDVQDSYEKMLDVSECIDELIEMQGENYDLCIGSLFLSE